MLRRLNGRHKAGIGMKNMLVISSHYYHRIISLFLIDIRLEDRVFHIEKQMVLFLTNTQSGA